MGARRAALAFARSLGFAQAWTAATLPDLPFDAVVDASNAPTSRRGRSSWSSRADASSASASPAAPSLVDTRTAVLKDVTAVGVLSASPGLDRHHRGVRERRASTRARWSPPPSGWTRSARCWPASGHQRAGPKVLVDPWLGGTGRRT